MPAAAKGRETKKAKTNQTTSKLIAAINLKENDENYIPSTTKTITKKPEHHTRSDLSLFIEAPSPKKTKKKSHIRDEILTTDEDFEIQSSIWSRNFVCKETRDTRKMTQLQLKQALSSRGLCTTGSKQALVLRLEEALIEEGYQPEEDDAISQLKQKEKKTEGRKLPLAEAVSPLKGSEPSFQRSVFFENVPALTFSKPSQNSKSYSRKKN